MKTILIILLLADSALAEYTPTELFTIGWGFESNQLAISEESVNGPGEPDEDIAPGFGPSMGYFDGEDKFVFSSYGFRQLKVFNIRGELVSSLLDTSTPINLLLGGQTIDGFIIDSSHIYIIGFPGLSMVPIIDYEGNVVDSLSPFGRDPSIGISGLALNFDGSITIYKHVLHSRISSRYIVTLRGDQFIPGGSLGFLASNGSYYSVWKLDSLRLRFNKYENPDTAGVAATRLFTKVSLPGMHIYTAEILNGGDGRNIYAYVLNETDSTSFQEIWIFDFNYRILDKIKLPLVSNKYDWFIRPFVSRDGTIYEFRCLDDGLHVVKWVKQ